MWILFALLMVSSQESQPTTRPAGLKLTQQERDHLKVLVAWNKREQQEWIATYERSVQKKEAELASPPKNRGKSFLAKWRDKLESEIAYLRSKIENERKEIHSIPNLTTFAVGNVGYLVGFDKAEIVQNVSETEVIVRVGSDDWWISGWRFGAQADGRIVDLAKCAGIIQKPRSYTTVLGAKRTVNEITLLSKRVVEAYSGGQTE